MSKRILRDLLEFARGAGMGATTDVLGYPVDLATMAMRPFGYNVPKPVGGSDWLAEQVTSPTGSLPETAGRTLVGMVTPGAEDLLRMAGLVNRAPIQELTTYHGSPHRINNVDEQNPLGKFDLSKVGTGEGNQMFGHGIYVAEDPAVARQYQTKLSNGGVYLHKPFDETRAEIQRRIDDALRYFESDEYANAVPDPKVDARMYELLRWKNNLPQAKDFTQAFGSDGGGLSALEQAGAKTSDLYRVEKGHFYTVDLPDEHISKMLDWDAPLSEQPEAVREVAARLGLTNGSRAGTYGDEITGAVVYKELEKQLEQGGARDIAAEMMQMVQEGKIDLFGKADQKASEYFRHRYGIPGIRYFDGGSRAAGEGTRNFVIFDPDIAKILKRE